MSACEWCWQEANRRVMFGGGSATDHYYQVMDEQEKAGKNALCPLAKAASALAEKEQATP